MRGYIRTGILCGRVLSAAYPDDDDCGGPRLCAFSLPAPSACILTPLRRSHCEISAIIDASISVVRRVAGRARTYVYGIRYRRLSLRTGHATDREQGTAFSRNLRQREGALMRVQRFHNRRYTQSSLSSADFHCFSDTGAGRSGEERTTD